ncbi:MAG TPA: tRNA pseudouridine(38-40) synthase TruA [Candidatus Omnitrophota bacterium]|nr:tRNA pseudouridine(38-40) synthase TruA [Candidatus Omnitrophota bacterium]HPN88550.1 tRNA pseudouridine(38-40) synthase TruA [Candidatus Omnitrophota bacterium]
MKNYKITIEYDGTFFNGWQVQTKNLRTVQGEIQKALKIIFKRNVLLIGSGRTDKGVHALGQTAHFKAETQMPTDEILRALNANLPDDIAIVQIKKVSENFHAQYNAKSKTYRYTLLNRATPSPQARLFYFFYPYSLNLSLMKKEAKHLLGKHDFKSFQSKDPSRPERGKDTIRTILSLNIKKKKGFIIIDLTANGFLYKMARTIVGTLIDIGRGKLPSGTIKKLLKEKNRAQASPTAQAKGLCLLKVEY